jgi:hypothetical protein
MWGSSEFVVVLFWLVYHRVDTFGNVIPTVARFAVEACIGRNDDDSLSLIHCFLEKT